VSSSASDSVTILVVDDDPGHCELIRRNLRRAGVQNAIETAYSGDEALAFVRPRCAQVGGSGLLLLLDVNMPGAVNGIDVLRQLKQDPVTRAVPVIMLTSTDDPREINRCYELGCNIYVTKPVDPNRFIEAVRRIGLFINIVSVPRVPGEVAP
jgi:CheY-like chemotaxis protein